MTAILVGRAPKGNFIVSDALASNKDNVKSYKECSLTNKIYRLLSSYCHCTLSGDATVLFGIQYLDEWNFQKGVDIDFTKWEVMQDALTATEKYNQVMHQESRLKPACDFAMVYFVNKEQVFKYEITLKKNKYVIENFRLLSPGEVVIRYGSNEKPLTGFDHPADKLFGKAKESIESCHKFWKEVSEYEQEQYWLGYDFDNRFCGVVYPKEKNEKEMLYFPFILLSDIIAADAQDPKLTWKLIEDKKFQWSPKDNVKPKRKYAK